MSARGNVEQAFHGRRYFSRVRAAGQDKLLLPEMYMVQEG